jgi:hypothetical protein
MVLTGGNMTEVVDENFDKTLTSLRDSEYLQELKDRLSAIRKTVNDVKTKSDLSNFNEIITLISEITINMGRIQHIDSSCSGSDNFKESVQHLIKIQTALLQQISNKVINTAGDAV